MAPEIYYLTLADIYAIANRVVPGFTVRDSGLLASAVARPSTVAFGVEAHPTLLAKAAALLHSLACNHPLIDGNKRLALSGAIVFLARNGVNIDRLDEDTAYDLMIDVAKGALDDVEIIASRLGAALGA